MRKVRLLTHASEEVSMTLSRQATQRHSDAGTAGRVQPDDRRSGAAKGNEGTTMPPRKMWLWFLFLLSTNYLLVRLLMPGAEEAITVPYTVFKDEVT
jgi:cell division protease FtsH